MDQSIKKGASVEREVMRVKAGEKLTRPDALAVEEPLEIKVGVESIAVTMRTPGDDVDLAAGFCLTEKIVDDIEQVESIEHCSEAEHGNVVVVTLSDGAGVSGCDVETQAKREMYLSSSCGLCGKQTIDRIYQQVEPIEDAFTVSADLIYGLPETMRKVQATFERTGGLHAAGLFDLSGALVVLREDIGRHNAVDKVIGQQALMGRYPLSKQVMLVSGRAGFEIIQKAALAGVPVVAAVGAPSSLAVDLAQRVGMTLIGFLRDEKMNVYTHAGRIG